MVAKTQAPTGAWHWRAVEYLGPVPGAGEDAATLDRLQGALRIPGARAVTFATYHPPEERVVEA